MNLKNCYVDLEDLDSKTSVIVINRALKRIFKEVLDDKEAFVGLEPKKHYIKVDIRIEQA